MSNLVTTRPTVETHLYIGSRCSKIHFIFHFSLLLLLTACEKEITYNGPDEQPMLVVNIIGEAGAPLAVEVSRSVFFLKVSEEDTDNLTLKDAVVNLSINGTSAALAYDPDSQAYIDSRSVHEGDAVAVTVTHPTYGKATASMTVPIAARAHFDSRTTAYIPKDSTESAYGFGYQFVRGSRTDSVWHASVVIDDREGTTGFYRLTINPTYTFRLSDGPGIYFIGYNGYADDDEENDDGSYTIEASVSYSLPTATQYVLDTNSNDPLEEFISIIPGLSDDDGSRYYSGLTSYLFTGEYLGADATTITFDIYLHTPTWGGGREYYYHPDWHYTSSAFYGDYWDPSDEQDYGNPWDIVGRDFVYTVNATLETLTPEYYYYLKSVEKYDGASWSPFSEPVQITCNIDGGIGIMAATSSRSFSFSRAYTFP
ncbi:MAG: DUF4249 family protein [Bacteroidaceae bacterium]|nr:DUF4249 family protein [Bacteroidaceae bacterium]